MRDVNTYSLQPSLSVQFSVYGGNYFNYTWQLLQLNKTEIRNQLNGLITCSGKNGDPPGKKTPSQLLFHADFKCCFVALGELLFFQRL